MFFLVFSMIFFKLSMAEPMPRTCEPIRVNLCSNLGYNMTAMPNFDVQQEADYHLKSFSPLIQYGCSPHLKLFLCSVYVPMCTEKIPEKSIGPCRGLCESVKSRCFPVLQGFGFPWPDALNCSRFPVENNHEHMCMEGPKDKIDIRAPIDPTIRRTECGPHGIRGQSGACVTLGCEGGIFDETERKIAEVWNTVWALACLTSSLASALTLTLGGGKVRALPLVVLAVCYCLIGGGWTLRSFAGRAGGSCGPSETRDASEDGLGNVNCAFVFLMLYYFGMAANAWWVCLCVWWVTRAALNWSPEKMRSLTTVLHVCAWGCPAAQTVTALVRRDVDSDDLTGTCYIGNKNQSTLLYLVLVPYLFYFCAGLIFLIMGWTMVLRRPKIPGGIGSATVPLTNGLAPRKERDFLGVICVLYAVPTFCVMVTYYYEFKNREHWITGTTKPALWAFLIRQFMSLFIGVSSIFWIWSKKSTQAWKSALKRLGPRKQPLKAPPVLRYPMHHQTLASHMGSVTASLNGTVRQSSRMHQHRKVPRSHHLRSGSETII